MIADDIRELISLFNQSDLTELSIERNGRKLFLRKGEGPEAQIEAPPEPVPPATTPLKAHMVGLFYWSKDKGAKPSVALDEFRRPLAGLTITSASRCKKSHAATLL